MIIDCPHCRQRLRIPEGAGVIGFRCPSCSMTSYLDRDLVHEKPFHGRGRSPKKPAPFLSGKSVAVVAGLIVFGLLVIPRIVNKDSGPSSRVAVARGDAPHWIKIEYRDLLDSEVIIRTGDKLIDSLGEARLRGAIQPHVDGFSYLLQHAVEMLNGPDAYPLRNIVDHFPVGSKQPAWVSILRGGRLAVWADGRDLVRLFLPGRSPRQAYEGCYSVIRHALKALLPDDGLILNVQVYSYEHDYGRSELSLNNKPYVFKAAEFASPPGTPLDLEGLAQFFARGGQLEGVQIDEREGLVLYAREGKRETVAGQPIGLSDFAVAYRAVFHAGDNEAFISLDPHRDPTQVTVNFGGFLEDTRIGAVVLEADKRFKTIASGLDPNTYKDVRNETRRIVSDFLTSDERDFLFNRPESNPGWIGTRFWFYPDSIEVETDSGMRYGLVARPRFTADAERSREDFATPAEFETRKRTTLPLSIRECIDQVNANYESYERAYREIRELTTVARLMGICSWLKKADTRQVDLDALLLVELPAFRTERERTRMISVAYLAHPVGGPPGIDYIKKHSRVLNLSSVLDMAIGSYFKNAKDLDEFLRARDGSRDRGGLQLSFLTASPGAGSQIIREMGSKPVRSIIRSKSDVLALATYAADRINVQAPEFTSEKERRLRSLKAGLDALEAEMSRMEYAADIAGTASLANYYIDQYNTLAVKYERQRLAYNRLVDEYNVIATFSVSKYIQVSGGINMEPKHFKIRKAPDSPALKKFITMTTISGTDLKARYEGRGYIKSRSGTPTSTSGALPKMAWETASQHAVKGEVFESKSNDVSGSYWTSKAEAIGHWRSSAVFSDGSYFEKVCTGKGKITILISDNREGRLVAISAESPEKDRIVFRTSAEAERLRHTDPPLWWDNK